MIFHFWVNLTFKASCFSGVDVCWTRQHPGVKVKVCEPSEQTLDNPSVCFDGYCAKKRFILIVICLAVVNELVSHLPLQMLLYFNMFYFPCWWFSAVFMLEIKVSWWFTFSQVSFRFHSLGPNIYHLPFSSILELSVKKEFKMIYSLGAYSLDSFDPMSCCITCVIKTKKHNQRVCFDCWEQFMLHCTAFKGCKSKLKPMKNNIDFLCVKKLCYLKTFDFGAF